MMKPEAIMRCRLVGTSFRLLPAQRLLVMYAYASNVEYATPMTIASVGGTYSLAPARAGARVQPDGCNYCPGETLKMSAQLQQPPNRSGPACVPLPPGLERLEGSKTLQPMVIEPFEREADSRSEPDVLHSSAASTADTDAGEGRAAAGAVPVPVVGLGERALNPAELPTRGSAGHYLGGCKPCAFVYKGGCDSGYDCQFCHLCLPGEKIRRKKELKQRRKAQKQS